MASLSSFVPLSLLPVYSASKGGYILAGFPFKNQIYVKEVPSPQRELSPRAVWHDLTVDNLAAGVAMFTRSLAEVGMGIRVNALCPKFVDTGIQATLPPSFVDDLCENVGFVSMEKVVAAAFSLLDDESKAGECVWVSANRPTQMWPVEETNRKYHLLTKNGSSNGGGVFGEKQV